LIWNILTFNKLREKYTREIKVECHKNFYGLI
jgi:hypothetical protein